MFTVNKIICLENFEAWDSARTTQQVIIDAGMSDRFDDLMNELYPDGLDETGLNDLLRFEDDWLYETLGIDPDDYADVEDEDE